MEAKSRKRGQIGEEGLATLLILILILVLLAIVLFVIPWFFKMVK